ncbi:methylenetetrahydrofolate reductase C-terminal domain-containing protein, partial [Clostridioides difficile]|uniref:methylenetetrahydrofolate reductase C-terminal domain-containing protein n=1 Tax=Clostridioides difficile TaxID=1496 RepID=UPI003F8D26B3
FIGEVQRVGEYEEACKACGDCELGWTGGICPVTMCAKGLMNGVAVEGKLPVYFHGRPGGMTPTPAEIVEKAKKIIAGELVAGGA